MNKEEKIYVGGCFDDYLEIRNIQNALKKNGFEISYDWTIRAEETIKERIDNVSNVIRTTDRLQEEADLDINGVYSADWTIFLITKRDYVYRGTFCELGASIMRDMLRNKNKKTIILSNKDTNTYAKTLCFYHHPGVIHVNTIVEAIKIIKITHG